MSQTYFNELNPKRHGLFGQLDTWGGGGVESTHFGKTYCKSYQFHLSETKSISYKS
jgi:hypothetical protein